MTVSNDDILVCCEGNRITFGSFGSLAAGFEISPMLRADVRREENHLLMKIYPELLAPSGDIPADVRVYITAAEKSVTVTVHAMYDLELGIFGVGKTHIEYFEKLSSDYGGLPCIKANTENETLYALIRGKILFDCDRQRITFPSGESIIYISRNITELPKSAVNRLPRSLFKPERASRKRSLKSRLSDELESRMSKVGGILPLKYSLGSRVPIKKMMAQMKVLCRLNKRCLADRLCGFIVYLHGHYGRIPHSCNINGENAEITINVFEESVLACAQALADYNKVFGKPQKEAVTAVTDELEILARLSCHGMMPADPRDTAYFKRNFCYDSRFHGSRATTDKFIKALTDFLPIAKGRKRDNLEAVLKAAEKYYSLNFCEGDYMPYRVKLIKKPHKLSGICDRCRKFAELTAVKERYLCAACCVITEEVIKKRKMERLYAKCNRKGSRKNKFIS